MHLRETTAPTAASAAGAAGAAGAEAAAGGAEIGHDEFLRLLVAQIGAQDPLSPMESTEFVTQLSQLSSVEQMARANRNLELIQMAQVSAQNAALVGFLGREVEAAGDTARLPDQGGAPIAFDLQGEATGVTVEIRDQQGALVRSLAAGARAAGPHEVEWDGRSGSGERLPAGDYRFSVIAHHGEEAVAATTRVRGTVTGVLFEDGVPWLIVGGARVRLSDIVSVRLPA